MCAPLLQCYGGGRQGIRIINLLDAAIYFSQIISLLSHTNLTKSHEGCIAKGSQLSALPPTRNERRLRRLPVYRHKGVQLAAYCSRMASTSVASALREFREICVKIKCLREKEFMRYKPSMLLLTLFYNAFSLLSY